jgi:hypothetical protein
VLLDHTDRSPTATIHSRGTLLLLAPLCAVTLGACGERTPLTPQPVQTRDSAGITIVEYQDLLLADSTAWTVDTTAAVHIGVVDGEDPYVFGRIAGTTRLSDGRIVIADAIAHQIRFFDRDGRFLHGAGGKGSGPGEYEYFSEMLRYLADSLVVIDYEGGRQNILDAQGVYQRSFRFSLRTENPRHYDAANASAVFGDGTYLLTEYVRVPGRPPFEFNVIRGDSAAFSRQAEEGGERTDLGTRLTRRIILFGSSGNTVLIYPDASAYWAAHGQRFYYADSKSFVINIHSADGSLQRIIRVLTEPRQRRGPPPVPTLSPNATRKQRAAAEQWKRSVRDVDWPEHLPAFGGFLVDALGNIWVREFREPYERETAERWFVFDSAGVLRYSLRMPHLDLLPFGFRKLRGEIGPDYVLGVRRDEDGVETVHLFALRKSRQ